MFNLGTRSFWRPIPQIDQYGSSYFGRKKLISKASHRLQGIWDILQQRNDILFFSPKPPLQEINMCIIILKRATVDWRYPTPPRLYQRFFLNKCIFPPFLPSTTVITRFAPPSMVVSQMWKTPRPLKHRPTSSAQGGSWTFGPRSVMRVVGFLKKTMHGAWSRFAAIFGTGSRTKKNRREITEIMIVSTGSESVD